MLTYEALLAESGKRGMPASKMRGVLREYLQVIILNIIYSLPEGRNFFFTGGTYLRLVHGTKRFSEDLDFNGKGIDKKQFERIARGVVKGLKKHSAEAKAGFAHRDNLLIANISFPAIEEAYGIEAKYGDKGIVIKLDMNLPKWKVIPETLLVAGYGFMTPVICTQKGALMADKIEALIKKERARHLYDIIFMLANKFPVDLNVCKSLSLKGAPPDLIRTRVASFSEKQLSDYAKQLKPFLFDENEEKLILNAKTIIPGLLEKTGGKND